MNLSLSNKKLFFTWALVSGTFFFAHAAHAAIIKPANNLGLVSYWSFDEGAGTSAADHSGNGNKGTLTGGASWAQGRLGQSMRVSGAGQYTQTTVSTPTTSYTISAWLRWQGSLPISSIKVGVAYGDGGANTVWMGYAADGSFSVSNSSTDLKSTTVSNSATWHHVVGVVSGGFLTGYVDGAVIGTTATGARGANTLKMGDYINVSLPWTGLIDEVRVYNRPLSSTEINYLYKAGATKYNTSSATLGNGSTLAQGLVGWWTFDGTTVGTTVQDSSGKGNNGYFYNGATSTAKVQGKLGQALNFAANTPQEVVIGTAPAPLTFAYNQPFSMSVWAKPAGSVGSGTFSRVVSIAASPNNFEYFIIANNNTFVFNVGKNGIGDNTVIGPAFTVGQWYHLTATFDGSTLTFYVNGVSAGTAAYTFGALASPDGIFSIGGAGNSANVFNGTLDDARVYNRALTASEVKQLYGQGGGKANAPGTTLQNGTSLSSGLAGYWSFNGPDVTDKVYDRSGNANNGYFYGGATSTAKVQGKLGQALNFDTTAYVSLPPSSTFVPSANSPITVSAWIKATNITGTNLDNRVLSIAKGSNASSIILSVGARRATATAIDGSGTQYNLFGNTILSVGKWYHLVMVFDGTTESIYVNGQSDGVPISASSAIGDSTTAKIGATANGVGPSLNFAGSIDEVRIYNRALTASEVRNLYMLGK